MPAGWGTAHQGEGRCKWHGGISRHGTDGRLKAHGLWSGILTSEQRAQFEEIKANADGLETTLLDGALALTVKLSEALADETVSPADRLDLGTTHLARLASSLASIKRARESADAVTAREELFRAQAVGILQRMVDAYVRRHGIEATDEWAEEVFGGRVPSALQPAPGAQRLTCGDSGPILET